jgi:hypothetical protein
MCGKCIIVFRQSTRISNCIGNQSRQLIDYSINITMLKMEFETIRCWLKCFDLDKMIIGVVEEGNLDKWVGVSQSLVLE